MEEDYQTFEVHPDYHSSFDQNLRIMKLKPDHFRINNDIIQGESYENGAYKFHPLQINNTPVLLIRSPKNKTTKIRVANQGWFFNHKTRNAKSTLEQVLGVPLRAAA